MASPAVTNLTPSSVASNSKPAKSNGNATNAGADESDLLFVLKILALYGGSESRRRIIATARTHPGGYLWSVIFDELLAHDFFMNRDLSEIEQ